MRFKVDENLPAELASILRDSDLEADTVTAENLSGADDKMILERCQAEDRVLITLDLDFANVRVYPPKSHSGIIVFRPSTQDKPHLIELLRRLIPVFAVRSPAQQLWIVEPDRIRYRDA